MAERARLYPALDLSWPTPPGNERQEQLLAELDDCRPTAVTAIPNGLRVFFGNATDRDAALGVVGSQAPDATGLALSVSDESWAERSQAALGPIEVDRLVVAPPWSLGDWALGAPTHRIVIRIVPSMGFGTGHHQSTRLCLRLLQTHPLSSAAVLDVGTGSGVLAIAAAFLGARRVLGVDVDEDALTSARENVELNAMGGRVTLEHLDLTQGPRALPDTFDVVTANITGAMVARHAPALASWIRSGGHLIVSGFTEDEEDSVAGALRRAGLTVVAREDEDEWVALAATSSPSPAGPQDG